MLHFGTRGIVSGRLVKLDELECIDFKNLINALQWQTLVNLPKTYYHMLIRSFYNNLKRIKDDDGNIELGSTIKGITITLFPNTLFRILGLPIGGEQFYNTSQAPILEYYNPYEASGLMCKNNEANAKPILDKLTIQA